MKPTSVRVKPEMEKLLTAARNKRFEAESAILRERFVTVWAGDESAGDVKLASPGPGQYFSEHRA